MKYPRACVALFAKAPVPGRVKTRLVPALGEGGACQLHARLLAHTQQWLLAAALCEVELWVDGDQSHTAFLLPRDRIHKQQGTDLGNRLNHAAAHILQRFEQVILIGSDCPALDADYLDKALEALHTGESDGVVGPAEDGGYVLLGLRSPQPQLFEGIPWGGDQVLVRTLAQARIAALSLKLLPVLADIDRPEDLRLLPPAFLPGA